MRARTCLLAWLILMAASADGGNSCNESIRMTPNETPAGSSSRGGDVILYGEPFYEGIGLGGLRFPIIRHMGLGTRTLTLKVWDPDNNLIMQEERKILGWQRWDKAICRLIPLAKTGRYRYAFKTEKQAEKAGVIDYQPRCRMRYVSISRGGGVDVIQFSRSGDGWEKLEVSKGLVNANADGALFYQQLADQEERLYKIRTDGAATLTMELPGMYTIRVWPNSTIYVREKRDSTVPLLGYRYVFNVRQGQYSALRPKRGDPPGALFNANHALRKPWEKWIIWVAEQTAEADKGFAAQTGEAYIKEQLGEMLENATERWGVGMLISGPWTYQVDAVETMLGGLWMAGTYSDFAADFPSRFAVPRSTAIRNYQIFHADADTHMSALQQSAAANMFHMVLPGESPPDFSPSHRRALEVYEWAYELMWLYGALYVPGDPGLSAVTREQAPPELLSRMGVLTFKCDGTGFIGGGMNWEPTGTEWTGGTVGRYAFAQTNTVWVMLTDGTEAQQVAVVDADMTIGQIAWSKDASRLAFTAWRTDEDDQPEYGEVWTVKADGTDCRRLIQGDPPATNAFDDTDHPWSFFTRDFFAGPDFSPDGGQVAVQRYRAYEDRDTNDVTGMERVEWQDVETCLLPTAGGAPATVDGSEWSRYLTKVPTRITGPPEIHAPFSMSAAWSVKDELLWPRSYEPAMTAASVYPNHGYANLTPFEFRFIYWDSCNQPPLQAGLWLDNEWIPMHMTGFVHGPETGWNDYRHGAVFSCSHTLPAMDVYTHSNHWMGAQGWNGQWVWQILPSLTSFVPVRDQLSNVSATLLNAEQAAVWGQRARSSCGCA